MYHFQDNNLDFRRVKITDTGFNKNVSMPPNADECTEAKIKYAKYELDAVIKEYEKMKMEINLTEDQQEGMKQLQDKRKKAQIMVYPTDKTGKLAIETHQSYKAVMKEHLVNTEQTTYEVYEENEKMYNAHMQIWCNIFGINDRTCYDFQSKNNIVPPIYGTRKDHKHDKKKPKENDPLRPICGAVVSANHRLSTFLSMILKPFIDESEETCGGTEDMLSRISEVNKECDLEGHTIGSFDVEALYPSIDVDIAIEGCKSLMIESTIEFENCDIDEVGLYLALNLSKDELKARNIWNYCPTRKAPGRKPGINGMGQKRNVKLRWKGWKKKNDTPNYHTEKEIIVTAVSIAIKAVIKNHIFTFEGNYYKQKSGAAIGVKVAGEVCKLFLVAWDRQLKRNLTLNNISYCLYSRYVDDGLFVVKGNNNPESSEKEIMMKIKEIANCIEPSMQVKMDYPGNNINGRMPVLDTEVWMDTIEVDGTKQRKILHSHYSKEYANKHVILKKSAMSYTKKINILINDLVRIMRNVSRLCPEYEREKHIQEYMLRLQISGYETRERINIYQKAKKRFQTMVKNDEDGICPLYRGKFWNRPERARKRNEKKHNWFSKKGHKATFFVEATPDEMLRKKCQKILQNCDLPIKVVEKAGTSLKQKLVRSDPYKKNHCSRASCKECPKIENGTCQSREVVYLGICEEAEAVRDPCPGKYCGETGRTEGERIPEHIRLYNNNDAESVFYQHMVDCHNGEKKDIYFRIIAHCPNDALLRQVTEAVYIKELKPSMNKKEEFGNSGIR